MARLRCLAMTLVPPLAYLAVVYLATRPPNTAHVFVNPTVITVSDNGGPAVLHAPPLVYPPRALRDRVEGSVTLQLAISGDGTVTRALAVSGPEPLRQAAADHVRQWQFEPKPQQTRLDVAFSLGRVTRSFVLPRPIRRTVPRYRGTVQGTVRLVVMVDPEGRVEFVQPVTGPECLLAPAVDSVRHWAFSPMLRDGRPQHGTVVVDVPFGL